VGGELLPEVVIPGFGVEGGVVACADGVIPRPGGELAVFGVVGEENAGGGFAFAFDFLVHGELVGVADSVLVDAGFDVPAGEVAAVGAGEGAGAESADGSALPVAVVDVSGDALDAGVFEGLADGAAPGCCGDLLGVCGGDG
jgi:hypothetical protein